MILSLGVLPCKTPANIVGTWLDSRLTKTSIFGTKILDKGVHQTMRGDKTGFCVIWWTSFLSTFGAV